MCFFAFWQGIPEAAEVAVPVPQTAGMSSGAVPVGPNSSPLNMFPQVKTHDTEWIIKSNSILLFASFSVTFCALHQAETLSQETISSTGAGLGSLDFLRNNPQVSLLLHQLLFSLFPKTYSSVSKL